MIVDYTKVMQLIPITLYVLTTSFALISLKLGSKDGAPIQLVNGRPDFNITPFIISGIVLYAISFVLYMYLISRYDLGYIIPLVTALVYVLIFLASFLIFKEAFTVMKVAAIALIILGLILLNLKT
jgi:drug/metabolite transporter (DMT)-like permease